MTTKTDRILAGQIILLKTPEGQIVAAGLASKLQGTNPTYSDSLRQGLTATKGDGTTITIYPRTIIDAGAINGQRILKVAFSETPRAPRTTTTGFCRCDGDADNRGRCYQCGGYQRHADAGRYL